MDKIEISNCNIILNQADLDRALAEMTDEEFEEAWKQLGILVRFRAKRIREMWNYEQD